MKKIIDSIILVTMLISVFGCMRPKNNLVATVDTYYSCRPKPPPATVEQVGDSTYCAEVAEAPYAFGKGPRVLFDEAHHNYGKISPDQTSPVAGRYHAFGELLKADGYQVDVNTSPITPATLNGYQLLVIIAPLPGDYFLPTGPNPVAYSGRLALEDSEVQAIKDWVLSGGSLLFNTEHSPFLPAAKNLLSVFGLSVEPNAYDVMTMPSQALEIAAPNHPIFLGRSRSERIYSLPTPNGVGGGVHLTSTIYESVALTRFGLGLMMTETLAAGYSNQRFHWFCKTEQEKQTPTCKAWQQEWLQGISVRVTSKDEPMKVLKVGQGRVAVFTEFSTLTSQIVESGAPYGGLQGKEYVQLTLNTLHWLTRALYE